MGNPQYIYLDTCIIQDYFWSEDPDEKKMSEKQINSLKSTISQHHPSIQVYIPQIVIGELINNYFEQLSEKEKKQSFKYMLDDLRDIQKDLKIEFVSLDIKSYKISLKVNREDERISGNDACIVGSALKDQYSSHLLSRDSDILESAAIDKLSKKLLKKNERIRRLKVSEYY